MMFEVLKRSLVVVAVGVGAVVLPSVAGANQWTDGGVPYSGPARAVGSLTQTLAANGATSTCNVTVTAQLANSGVPPLGVANAQVVSVVLSGCTTSASYCTFSTVFGGLPWSVTTSGGSITTSGIAYASTYTGGALCAFNGQSTSTTGSVTGNSTLGSNAITFSNASGLTTPFGPATLSGSLGLYVDDGTTSRPIQLS